MWWVQVFAVALGLELIHKMFCELQAHLLFIYQQRAYVNKLTINLQMVYELHRIDIDIEFGDLEASDYFQRFDWFVTFELLKLFIRNQGLRVKAHFDALDDIAQRDVLTLIGMIIVGIIQGIIDIQAKCNSRNKPANKEALPVISFDLIHVQLIMFVCDVLWPRSAHLIKANWDEDAIYKIKQQ
jgi:hypothetical protein